MFNTVDDSTKPQPSGATTEDAGITHNSNHAEFDELESLPGGANHGPTTNGQTSIYEGLRECEVYHGQLPEEDLVTMLHTDGDYILTLLQTEIKRAVVVWVKGNDAIKYLDFVIKIEPKSCSLDGITFRPTIVEIIAFHTIHGTPISSSDSTCIKLVRGVKRQSWELDAKNVITGKLLGEGAFGQVFLGMMFDDEKQIKVAIKVPRENPGKEKDVIKQAMNEARIQRRYCHQNIVRLYGVILNTKPFSIIMEYVDGGNLESHLKKTPLLMDTKMTYCFDVAMGMQYLHALSCLHRDMATRNCLVDNTYPCIKISDFGLSANRTSIAMDRSKPAPVRWMAPEVLKTAKYEAPADIS